MIAVFGIVLALGLSMSIRDVKVINLMTQSIFGPTKKDETRTRVKPTVYASLEASMADASQLVGLALFCGAVIATLTAWLFCSAHGKAVFKRLKK